MNRKHEAIDLMALYAKGSANGWNEFLTECFNKRDINRLAKVRYQICAGMDDIAKAKLNTDDINVWFVRLTMSLENTAKRILRKKYPFPQDNPLIAKESDPKYLTAKRKRDHELQIFMKESSY